MASLPAIVQADPDAWELTQWLARHAGRLEQEMETVGGVLFRGFRVDSPEKLRPLVDMLAPGAAVYKDRHTPRSTLGDGVFTSTDHPADQVIHLHNESSFSHQWPLRLVFCCVRPPAVGGSTSLADARAVLRRLSEETRRRFEREGVLYVRNFHPRLGLSWQETFQVDDRDALEHYCAAAGIETEWVGEGRLRTRQRRPAVAAHPRTGELVWFNQAHHFHPHSLGAATEAVLRRLFAEEDLPSYAYYGNGAPIAPETVDEVLAAYGAQRTEVRWERGDLLVVDNMLVAHGRQPYRGDRLIALVMSGLHPPLVAPAG